METINKKMIPGVFGKNIYLLGQDNEGINYWLESPSWDCGWYWSFGYVETYTNNKSPQNSRDIDSHTHIKSGNNENYKYFSGFFEKTTFNETEKNELIELFKAFYALRELADKYHNNNAVFYYDAVKNLLPDVMNSIIAILTPEGQEPIKYKLPKTVKEPEEYNEMKTQ